MKEIKNMSERIKETYIKLIKAWSDIPNSSPFIAAIDAKEMNLNEGKGNLRNFNFDFIPQPYWGNIINPKVIILTLNPGYYSKDDYLFNKKHEALFKNNLTQMPSLNWLEMEDSKDRDWWINTIKDFLDDSITTHDIYEKVGFFEFIGYHSKSFPSKKYQSYLELNKNEFGIEAGILPTQKLMFNHIENLLNQDEGKRPLVAIIWGQKFWLQGIEKLSDIDYIDTISTTSHLLSKGNLRPYDFKRLKEKLK